MIILLTPPEKFKSNLCTDYYYAYVYKNEYTILAPSSKLDEAMTKVADSIIWHTLSLKVGWKNT